MQLLAAQRGLQFSRHAINDLQLHAAVGLSEGPSVELRFAAHMHDAGLSMAAG